MKRGAVRVTLIAGWVCVLACGNAAAASEPVVLSPPGEDSWGQQVAVGERGDAAVIWTHDIDTYNSTVELSIRRPGGQFSQARTISDPKPPVPTDNPSVTMGTNEFGHLAVAPDGDVAAIWRWGDDAIRTIVIPADGSAPIRQTLNIAQHETPTTSLAIAYDAKGNAIAQWQDAALYTAYRPRGGSFGAAQAIPNPAAGNPQRAVFAASRNGDAVAAWQYYNHVYASVRPAGGSFGAPQELSTRDNYGPNVAVDPFGDAVVTWVDRPDGSPNGTVRAAYRPAGGGFGSPRALGDVFYSGYSVLPAMSRTGETTVALTGNVVAPEFRASIVAVTRSPNGTWGPYEAVATSGEGHLFALDYDAADNLHVAWASRYEATGHYAVLAASRAKGGSFSGAGEPISGTDANVGRPAVAGTLVAWPRGSSGGPFRIEAADLTSSGGGAAPGGSEQPPASPPAATGPSSPDGPAGVQGLRVRVRVPRVISIRALGTRGVPISVRCSVKCRLDALLTAARHHRIGRIRSSRAARSISVRLRLRHPMRIRQGTRFRVRISISAPTGSRVVTRIVRAKGAGS